jgi:Holliday junction resolvasome RuvABC ATP-dependent DNA helicase subunit
MDHEILDEADFLAGHDDGHEKSGPRLIDGEKQSNEQNWEGALRPKTFEEFPGQDRVKEKLKVFVEAARGRDEALDHILLSGPPGHRWQHGC